MVFREFSTTKKDAWEAFVNAPCTSTFTPGCRECQHDGMKEHYAGIHLCFGRGYSPPVAKQGREVWFDWIREQLPRGSVH